MPMTSPSYALSQAASPAQRAVLVRLWTSSAALAGLSAGVIWNAHPGINWLACVVTASLALLGPARAERTVGPVAPPLALAVLTAIGIVFTSSELLHFMSILAVLTLLALAIARARPERHARARLIELAALPVIIFVTCIAEAIRRATETLQELTNDRAVPVNRGAAPTIPIAGLLRILVSSDTPRVGALREDLEKLLSTWHFVPRLVFFTAIHGITLGALGYAASAYRRTTPRPAVETRPLIQLGETERLMVL